MRVWSLICVLWCAQVHAQDAEAEAAADGQTESGTEAGAESEGDTEGEADGESEPASEAGTAAGTETETEGETTATETETETETESGHSGTETETETEAEPDIPDATPPNERDAPSPNATEPSDAGKLPINVVLHGYYRARYNWFGNVPVFQRRMDSRRDQRDAHFAFQRLRLEPSVTYGDPNRPIAALHMQIDALDNVVFGDNARITRTPIFADIPSNTDIDGFDLADSFRLERAWLEALIPVGQIRVGRMPSHWGLGLLANHGNGLGEWGDPLFGTSFDRVLFATRPLTVINALTSNDSRPTPLIFAIAYDKLVEDPVTNSTDPPTHYVSLGPFGPLSSSPARFETRAEEDSGFANERSQIPFSTWTGEGNDVNQMAVALVWKDDEFGRFTNDLLHIGGYYVYRWQHRGGALRDLPEDAAASRVHIVDLYWKLRYGLGRGLPTLYSEGEVVGILGRSNTITLPGGCDVVELGVCNQTDASIWGGAFRAGFMQERGPRPWGALMEWGWSGGDNKLFDTRRLTMRPLHPDYHVGLLLYQVALATQTAIQFGEEIRPLWSRGGVWNSHYMFPQLRAQIIPGIEAHLAFLMAWARDLTANVYNNERPNFETNTNCGPFERECKIGWEVDVALRFKWGEGDLLRWDTEFGFMRAGDALLGSRGFGDRFLWTAQTRLALVF